MLNGSRLRRSLAWLLLTMLLAAGVSTAVVSTAQADPQLCAIYDDYGNVIGYDECTGGPGGGPGGPGGDNGGGGGPSCDLTPSPPSWGEPPYTFCEGTTACTYENTPSGYEDAPGHDFGPQPSPDHILVVKWCRDAGSANPYSEVLWIDSSAPNVGPPPLAEQARRAHGTLAVPDFSLQFGPTDEGVTGLDTHFWISGPGSGEIIGSPTFTLIAVGVPSHIEIDPGDGGPTITCPWTTQESPSCAKKYLTLPQQSRMVDGRTVREFDVVTTIVYDVHFEPIGGGAPLNIPGLGSAYLTIQDSETTPVPVGELQALVTR